MKKLLSLIIVILMLSTVLPAYASTEIVSVTLGGCILDFSLMKKKAIMLF